MFRGTSGSSDALAAAATVGDGVDDGRVGVVKEDADAFGDDAVDDDSLQDAMTTGRGAR